jgi:hypothetical protein
MMMTAVQVCIDCDCLARAAVGALTGADASPSFMYNRELARARKHADDRLLLLLLLLLLKALHCNSSTARAISVMCTGCTLQLA